MTTLFVTVGKDSTTGNTIQYSSDGINWENCKKGGFSGKGHGVAYNPIKNMWVAVGDGPLNTNIKTIQYSSDGINWENSKKGGFMSMGRGIAYNPVNNMWVAVGRNDENNNDTSGNAILHSSDGINWKNSNKGGFESWGYGGSI